MKEDNNHVITITGDYGKELKEIAAKLEMPAVDVIKKGLSFMALLAECKDNPDKEVKVLLTEKNETKEVKI